MTKTIQNDLLLRVLNKEEVVRPPVWMMRQAGRYLPEFRKLREKYDFFTRCRIPEIAAEITVQPVDMVGVDAAILFSDILVLPQAMNIPFKMQENQGPWLEKPIRTQQDIDNVIEPDVSRSLNYVMDAIKLSKELLADRVPLIGFAGSPWTILCYVVEGKGSKNFDKAKEFCFLYPELAKQLLQKITDTTIVYLQEQVKAGVDLVQIFDSWGGVLSYQDYLKFSWPYLLQIVHQLAAMTYVIVFAKGCWFALEEMAKSPVSALGIDWTCPAMKARQLTHNKVVLQGNLDPARLLAPITDIKILVAEMINDFGKNYIVNLGHGILPNIPVSHAQAFVDAVKSYHY